MVLRQPGNYGLTAAQAEYYQQYGRHSSTIHLPRSASGKDISITKPFSVASGHWPRFASWVWYLQVSWQTWEAVIIFPCGKALFVTQYGDELSVDRERPVTRRGPVAGTHPASLTTTTIIYESTKTKKIRVFMECCWVKQRLVLETDGDTRLYSHLTHVALVKILKLKSSHKVRKGQMH